jgi:hypothetical protein
MNDYLNFTANDARDIRQNSRLNEILGLIKGVVERDYCFDCEILDNEYDDTKLICKELSARGFVVKYTPAGLLNTRGCYYIHWRLNDC